MNLRHIEIFHAVYLHSSVSGAARALGVSQPAVSKTLRHAESLLGFALFERTGGRLVPTADAHVLFGEASGIQDRVQQLREAGRNLRRGAGAMLRVSALPSLALEVLPGVVARFLARRPEARFDLQTVHHDDLVRKLYERETDLAIASHVPPGAPIGHRRLGEGELALLYREADLPDAPPRLPLATLAGRRFIGVAASGPIGQLLGQELARIGLELDEIVSARTFYIAAGLVRQGVGMTVVDGFTARAAAGCGLAARPLAPRLGFDVHAMFLPDRPPSALAGEFLAEFAKAIAAA